jgi:hypothetical protein
LTPWISFFSPDYRLGGYTGVQKNWHDKILKNRDFVYVKEKITIGVRELNTEWIGVTTLCIPVFVVLTGRLFKTCFATYLALVS